MATLSRLKRIEHKLSITADDPDGVVCVLRRLTFGEFNDDKAFLRKTAFQALRASAPALALQQEPVGDTDGDKLASLLSSMSKARVLLDPEREAEENRAEAEAMDYLRGFIAEHLLEVRNIDDCEDGKAFVLEQREFCIELADRLREEATPKDSGKP